MTQNEASTVNDETSSEELDLEMAELFTSPTPEHTMSDVEFYKDNGLYKSEHSAIIIEEHMNDSE